MPSLEEKKINQTNQAHIFDFSNQFANSQNNFSYKKKKDKGQG